MEKRLIKELKKREGSGLLRTLKEAVPMGGGRISYFGKEFVNFSSNDYLGLSAHPEIIKSSVECGKVFGSSASRLMTGNTKYHRELERLTASFKGKEACLLYNSGYQANIGIISALGTRRTAIFSDKLNHASIVDGTKLSGAKVFRFSHNDTEHLGSLLDKERSGYEEAIIITETVFSMDGDIAPLGEIVELKNKHNCMLIVDEAHATGVFGPDGSGMSEEKGLTEQIDVIMGTFSKALGAFGAYVATNNTVRNYLINFSRSFIYSTALPVPVINAGKKAIDIVQRERFRREELLKNAKYLRDTLKAKGFNVLGESQIIPIVTGDNDRALRMSEYLKDNGFWALPVRHPTVPLGRARLRISLSYDHKKEIIDKFIKVVENYGK